MSRTMLRTVTFEDPPVVSPGDFPASHRVIGRAVQNADTSFAYGWIMNIAQVRISVL